MQKKQQKMKQKNPPFPLHKNDNALVISVKITAI